MSISALTRREEHLLVGDEGDEEADREGAGEDRARPEVDDEDAEHAEEQRVRCPEEQVQPLGGELAVGGLDEQREPVRPPVALAVEELDRAHAAHRLEEMAVPPRRPDDVLGRGLPQRHVEGPAQEAVGDRADQRHRGQRRREPEDHRDGDEAHDPVEDRDHEVGGQRLQDRLLAVEPRHHVADVPRLEVARRAARSGARRGWCAPAPSARRRASSASSRGARSSRPGGAAAGRRRRQASRAAPGRPRRWHDPRSARGRAARAARRPRSRRRGAAGARAPAASR